MYIDSNRRDALGNERPLVSLRHIVVLLKEQKMNVDKLVNDLLIVMLMYLLLYLLHVLV
jgi:hypothetical protein